VVVTPEVFIGTNRKQEISMQGIFAARDICGERFQLAKSLGEGCVAGINAAKYIEQTLESE
jgi:thioredoxin reductase (NADPH)